jgi:hypothetical protein
MCQDFFPHKTSLFQVALTTPFHPLPPTIYAGTTLLRTYHWPHSSLYNFQSLTASFLFWILDLKVGPIGCPETSVRNYHYKLHSSQGECGSHLLYGGKPKSHPNLVAKPYILPQCHFVINYINTYGGTNKLPVSFPPPLRSCYLPTKSSVCFSANLLTFLSTLTDSVTVTNQCTQLSSDSR